VINRLVVSTHTYPRVLHFRNSRKAFALGRCSSLIAQITLLQMLRAARSQGMNWKRCPNLFQDAATTSMRCRYTCTGSYSNHPYTVGTTDSYSNHYSTGSYSNCIHVLWILLCWLLCTVLLPPHVKHSRRLSAAQSGCQSHMAHWHWR